MKLHHDLRNLIFVLSLLSSTTMSQWLQTSGPFSDNPVAFLSTAAKGDTIFAGSYQFDIMYRSTDNGITWTENLPTDHVNVLKIINNTVCTPVTMRPYTDHLILVIPGFAAMVTYLQ